MSDTNYAHSNLDRLFHAPARLSIATALYAHGAGLIFAQLKQACELSDGNLSRHVSRMEQESVVKSEKVFMDRIPQTTISLTAHGRSRFEEYIESLRRIVDAQATSMNPHGDTSPRDIIYE